MKEFFLSDFIYYLLLHFSICCSFVLFMCRNSSSEEECAIVDSDDDDTRSSKWNTSIAANAKRPCLDVSAKNTQMPSARNTQMLSSISKSGRRMGVIFGSDESSEEDEFDRSIPQRKRKR